MFNDIESSLFQFNDFVYIGVVLSSLLYIRISRSDIAFTNDIFNVPVVDVSSSSEQLKKRAVKIIHKKEIISDFRLCVMTFNN